MQDYWERREEMWDDYFAAGDAIRERYASELEDLRQDDLAYEDEMEYRQKVKDSGFDSPEEYEAYWKHCLEAAEREHG
ncbi:hypothetical protein CMI37_27890 [Candidatus Pacearchaeota archaeon]|nr:hypothetical protein [Candidatus Pacearchaeota archaeon]|tara:strand:- start:2969 stop:3202 length:234 start_codon:yes stop_codon:yes gene_type:complete